MSITRPDISLGITRGKVVTYKDNSGYGNESTYKEGTVGRQQDTPTVRSEVEAALGYKPGLTGTTSLFNWFYLRRAFKNWAILSAGIFLGACTAGIVQAVWIFS